MPTVEFTNNLPLDTVIDATLINVTGMIENSEHSKCGNLYFNTEDGTLFCMNCFLRDNADIACGSSERIIIDGGSTAKYISCSVFDEHLVKVTRRYVLEIATKTLYEIPALATNDIELISICDDTDTLITIAERRGDPLHEDVYAINIKTGEYRLLTEGYDTFMHAGFLGDGRYVRAALKNSYEQTYDFYSESCSFLVCDLQTGNRFVCNGAYSALYGSTLITKTHDGFNVYDLESGKLTEKDLPVAIYEDGVLSVAYTGKTDKVELIKNTDCRIVSDDGLFVYTYTTGDSFARCFSTSTCEYFAVPLNDLFCKSAYADSQQYKLCYSMYLSKNGKSLMIYYYTTEKPEPESSLETARRMFSDGIRENQKNGIQASAEAIKKAIAYDNGLLAEISDRTFFFVGDGYCFLASLESFDQERGISMSDIVSISKKGSKMSAKDFEPYIYKGLKISNDSNQKVYHFYMQLPCGSNTLVLAGDKDGKTVYCVLFDENFRMLHDVRYGGTMSGNPQPKSEAIVEN